MVKLRLAFRIVCRIHDPRCCSHGFEGFITRLSEPWAQTPEFFTLTTKTFKFSLVFPDHCRAPKQYLFPFPSRSLSHPKNGLRFPKIFMTAAHGRQVLRCQLQPQPWVHVPGPEGTAKFKPDLG